MRRGWTLAIVASLAAADQLLKWWVQRTLGAGRVIRWGSVLAFRYVRNTGAAFSMLSSHTTLLSVGTGLLLAAGIAALLSGKVRSRLLYAALTLALAGGLGNWIDRVRLGFVTDYIEPLFVQFAVFNFADILITVGAALIVVWLIADTAGVRREKKAQP